MMTAYNLVYARRHRHPRQKMEIHCVAWGLEPTGYAPAHTNPPRTLKARTHARQEMNACEIAFELARVEARAALNQKPAHLPLLRKHGTFSERP